VTDEEIFFCIGRNDLSRETGLTGELHALRNTTNALYIPGQDGAPNVRIYFGSEAQRRDSNTIVPQSCDADFAIHYLREGGSEVCNGRYNAICRNGTIAFSVKFAGDDWSEEVLQYTRDPVADVPDAPNSVQTDLRGLAIRRTALSHRLKYLVPVCALALFGILVSALGVWQYEKNLNERKLEQLALSIAPSPGRNYIITTTEGIQVFSTTASGAQWIRQLLLKAPPGYPVRVASLQDERRRVETRLDNEGVRFVTVRLEDPARPTLVVIADATEAEKARALEAVRAAMPYSRTFAVAEVTLRSLDEQAQALLSATASPFSRAERKDGATYLITGALGDESLASLQQLVGQFSQKWGTRSIDFRVQIRTDWLKGKTYREGGDGYVLLDPASWFFPHTL
jgi:type III secretion system PrgH/EprH family protein